MASHRDVQLGRDDLSAVSKGLLTGIARLVCACQGDPYCLHECVRELLCAALLPPEQLRVALAVLRGGDCADPPLDIKSDWLSVRLDVLEVVLEVALEPAVQFAAIWLAAVRKGSVSSPAMINQLCDWALGDCPPPPPLYDPMVSMSDKARLLGADIPALLWHFPVSMPACIGQKPLASAFITNARMDDEDTANTVDAVDSFDQEHAALASEPQGVQGPAVPSSANAPQQVTSTMVVLRSMKPEAFQNVFESDDEDEEEARRIDEAMPDGPVRPRLPDSQLQPFKKCRYYLDDPSC